MIILILTSILKILTIIVPLLLSVAYFTIAERKIMGIIQRRKGPNVIGFLGLLQPLADGLKLFAKETILPSNSKYPFLGALRSAAQMISYEVSIGFVIINIALCTGSFNLSNIVLAQKNAWYIFSFFPMFIIFCISMLAETNRHPFDLPEAEAELVSGYNVEYSAMTFALFFLGEYANMLLMSSFVSILFLGGWLPLINIFPINLIPGSVWFSFKIILGVIFFIVTRATLPRYRYDQLMHIGWKCFLPFSIGYLLFTVGLLISFNWLPN